MHFRPILLMSIGLAVGSSAHAVPSIWTETFDTGVGRLNQTRDGGASYYVWNPATQSMDGTFRRAPETIARYATLGETFDLRSATRGFQIIATPTGHSGNATGVHRRGLFGFMNSTGDNLHNFLVADFNYLDDTGLMCGIDVMTADGTRLGPYRLPLTAGYGHTYFFDVLVTGGVVSFSAYEGADATGQFVGTLQIPLDLSK